MKTEPPGERAGSLRCHTQDVASVEFHNAASKLSTTLLGVSGSLPAGKVSLRDLLELIGEQGMLSVCVFLTLPSLIPVSIPGVSTVFGLAIILIGRWRDAQPRAVASAPDSGTAVVDCAHQAGVRQGCPSRRSFRADGASSLALPHADRGRVYCARASARAGGSVAHVPALVPAPFSNTFPAVRRAYCSCRRVRPNATACSSSLAT